MLTIRVSACTWVLMTQASLHHRPPSYKHSPFLVHPRNHHPQPWVLALLLPERTTTFLPHNISVGKPSSPSTSPLCALPHPNLTNTQDAGIPHQVFSQYKSIFSLPYVFTSTPHSHGVSAGLWPDLCTGTVLQVCSGWGCEWDGEIPLASVSLRPELRVGSVVALPHRFR